MEMSKGTQKFLLSTGLIGTGIALITWGFRPKSQKEKIAEQVSYWRPDKVSFSDEQRRDFDRYRAYMNALRTKIRAHWSSADTGLDVHRKANYASSLANNALPWPVQDISTARIEVGKGSDRYTTDLVSPHLQTVFARWDVALHLCKIANLPKDTPVKTAADLAQRLTAREIEALADVYAREFGTLIPATAALNYDVLSAKEMAKETKENMPGRSLLGVQEVQAWIALNTPLSDLSAEERATLKKLRQSEARQPRVLVAGPKGPTSTGKGGGGAW